MTIQKLIDKYTKLQRGGYETMFISQVINDLWQIRQQSILRRQTKEERNRKIK
jgi:hypothetical protein